MEHKSSQKARRKYDASFKAEVVSMIAAGRSVPDISRSLGIGENIIYRWRQKALSSPQELVKRKIEQSMSRANNPYDNAFMESHFSRFKAELLEDGIFDSVEDAHTEIFEYIEMYYNSKRKHSALNYQSPMQYENHYFYSLTKQDNCP